MIQRVNVGADINPDYSTSPGNSTTEPVFLLSAAEEKGYFNSGEERKCVPTPFAIEQGAETNDKYKVDGKAAYPWRLRTPGFNSAFAVFVGPIGTIATLGCGVIIDAEAVRPACGSRLEFELIYQ